MNVPPTNPRRQACRAVGAGRLAATLVMLATLCPYPATAKFQEEKGMKMAFSLAAAGLALASAISHSEGIEVFQDVHADPRWTNTTVVSPLSLTSNLPLATWPQTIMPEFDS